MYGMSKEKGLTDVTTEPFTGVFTDYTQADQILGLRPMQSDLD